MTHNWYSPQKDAEILDAKKLSFGMAAVLASSTLISANSANAHAETTTASASTETGNAAGTSTVSTNSGLVVGKTGNSNVSTAAAGTTAGTQTAASSTTENAAVQATTSSSNSSSNFAEEHKDLLDRAKADGITVTKDESKTYNNQEDADEDIADQASAISWPRSSTGRRNQKNSSIATSASRNC